MKRRVKAIQYGVGAMGKIFVPYMLERGVDVVAAIGNTSGVGEDLGDVCGLDRKLNVTVASEAERVLSETDADIVILPIFSLVDEMYEHLRLCAENGKNAITICEEAFYPWTTSPTLTSKLDRLAKANGVTICGSGYQDIFWGHLISLMSGGSQRIDSIYGVGQFNVDDYGPVVAKHHGAGLDDDEFAAEFGGNEIPSFMRNCVEMICSHIGWTIKEITQETLPTKHDSTVTCASLGIEVPPGRATGKREIVKAQTEHGPSITAELVGKAYAPGEEDLDVWTLSGVPDIKVEVPRPRTDLLTCSSVVNRIPDVINAAPGYITVDRLPAPIFKPYHLGHYVDAF